MERLYLLEKLSAAKIAQEYGLKYKNPKVAESTVLYHLKRYGIARRDRADHVRKVTDEMVDEWVTRYIGGESLSQIAPGQMSPATVWHHLRSRGVHMRDKLEAQIKAIRKYDRRPFAGDEIEKAYLIGLRYGDLHAVRHGRAVRVRVSTTHPAMADLFDRLFSPYGHVARYPRRAKLVAYEWTLECDLDDSFVFLLNKPPISELEQMRDKVFLGFLAGLFDAEGSVYLHKKRGWYNAEVSITNSDRPLIEFLFSRLRRQGYGAHEVWRQQKDERRGVKGKSTIGRVVIWKFEEVQRFLRIVNIRHGEKIAKAGLISRLCYGGGRASQLEIASKWEDLKDRNRAERGGFLEAAALAIQRANTAGKTPT